MGKLLGVLLIGASWLGGLAFGLYAWIVWGLMATIDTATADGIVGSDLAWGIVWLVFLAKLIATVIIWVGTFIGGLIVAASD